MLPVKIQMMLAAMLALSACQQDSDTVPTEGRAAEGAVLPGTIDDAMIPLDQLRSQGELAEPDPDEGAQGRQASGLARGGASGDDPRAGSVEAVQDTATGGAPADSRQGNAPAG
ncbi:hypothetical protein RM533_06195 [Croceicoccus sp. F390]|uniref:Argininosuccinate lyase n=1 Tax=Croceicoccus esteveae TaxID=3075597 RepID=A0ABU2ZGQ1_9SPHN|nr:hypothetical protein [Croceicoccus sp. F390]MDT0575772.1 hypothetical protein [Croceicoccus sp. F390]